jgi:hypothetical protein
MTTAAGMGVLDTTLSYNILQVFMESSLFSPRNLDSTTNKIKDHDITAIHYFIPNVMVLNQYNLPSWLVVSLLRAFIDPVFVLSIFLPSLIFVMVCGLFKWKRICKGFFIVCLYVYCRWGYSYKEGRIRIPLAALTSFQARTWISNVITWCSSCVQWVNVRGGCLFSDIVGIVGNHCFNIPFIIF